jgi:predicted outer membrane repeat protein
MGITDYGGALFIQMQDLDNPMSIISDSTFYANSAGQWGGAIYINNQNLTLLGNTFMNNNAQYGGAIYFDCQSNEIFFLLI